MIEQPTPDAAPDNIVSLGENIDQTATKAASELERKRLIQVRSTQIVIKQLEHDALKMEESAIVGEHTIQRRHEMMDTARCLRVTTGWLTALTATEPETQTEGAKQ